MNGMSKGPGRVVGLLVLALVWLEMPANLGRQYRVVADEPGRKTSRDESNRPMAIWREARTLTGYDSAVWSVAFSPDGKRLATGTGGYLGAKGQLKIWDAVGGKEIVSTPTDRSVRWISFAPDGKTLATAEHEDQGAACIRETENGRIIRTLVGHNRPTDTAVSFDGKLVVTASWDKTLIVWDAQTGKELRTFTGHTGEVYPVAFDPKSRLVLSGDATGTAILWNADTGELLRKLQGHTKTVQAVAFSRDGKTLATAAWDQTIKLWNPATGEELATLKGHEAPVLDISFSPDGMTLASVSGHWGEGSGAGASSGEVILWDFARRQAIASLRGHAERIFGVSFSADGRMLATASWDKTVKIWRGLRARSSTAALTATELGKLWDRLASNDFLQGAEAAETLAGAPDHAVPFLVERLDAIKPVDNDKQITGLVAQLEADTFAAREQAAEQFVQAWSASRGPAPLDLDQESAPRDSAPD
jgi:WD40 repeat protein